MYHNLTLILQVFLFMDPSICGEHEHTCLFYPCVCVCVCAREAERAGGRRKWSCGKKVLILNLLCTNYAV